MLKSCNLPISSINFTLFHSHTYKPRIPKVFLFVRGWLDLDMIKPLLELIIYIGFNDELFSKRNF